MYTVKARRAKWLLRTACQPRFDIEERVEPWIRCFAVHSRHIYEYRMHANRGRAEIIDPIHITHIKALVRSDSECLQRCVEYARIGLFVPDDS